MFKALILSCFILVSVTVSHALTANPAGDRSLNCSTEDGENFQGEIEITRGSVATTGNGRQQYSVVLRRERTIVARGSCTSTDGDGNTCSLIGESNGEAAPESPEGQTYNSGSISKKDGELHINLQRVLHGRAEPPVNVTCSRIPCVVYNFIETGFLDGNGSDSCK